MAERIQVELVDDLDGSPAQSTVTFALDGVTYEIDLNDRNAGQLRSLLDWYIKKARASKPAGTKQKEREERRVRQANKDLTAQIRGAAQRSKDRLHQETEAGAEQQADAPAEPTEPAESPLHLGSGVFSAAQRSATATTANLEADPSSEVNANSKVGPSSETDPAEISAEDAADDRVPAVAMPQFSSAE